MPAPPRPLKRVDATPIGDTELLDACRADLEELGLGDQEQLELIGAIQCIVENVLSRKYRLHEDG